MLCQKKIIVTYKTFNIMKVNEIMANLEAKHPGENEYLQAVREVLETIEIQQAPRIRGC